MNRFLSRVFLVGTGICLLIGATVLAAHNIQDQDDVPHNGKVLREYKGIKLDMTREQVLSAMGNPAMSNATSDDFKLENDDLMTVHFDNGKVKAIQLMFLEPKNAPQWADVVGNAKVRELENGGKTARVVMSKENFWVSIYQSKDGTTIRITISH